MSPRMDAPPPLPPRRGSGLRLVGGHFHTARQNDNEGAAQADVLTAAMTATPTRTPNAPGTRFRLGDWLVAADENALLRGTEHLTLEPKVMRVLVYLAEHAGEVVSTEQLLIDCWRGTFYGDNPVHKTIALLRKALDDDPGKPRYIQTIRKRGYRIIVPVVFPEQYSGSVSEAVRAWSGGCPFRGLEPFEARHAEIFFGRSRATAGLLQALHAQIEDGCAFVLIVGASGSGKSSLLHAGALPLLSQDGGFDGLHAVFSASVDPGHGAPLRELAAALTRWRYRDWPLFLETEIPRLSQDLEQDLDGVLARIRIGLEQAGRRDGVQALAIIIVDPFESLLNNEAASRAEREAFVRALSAFAQSGYIAVLAPCRSDLYPRLGEIPALIELKNIGGQYDVLAPSAGEIAEMIRLPARAAGLSFGRDPDSRVRLDDALRDDASRNPDALPLLQHVLRELYERRASDGELPFSAYRDIGGLEGALARHAETLLGRLPGEVASTLPSLLQRMVSVSEDGTVSGRSIAVDSPIDDAQRQLLQAFIDARLFVGRLSEGGARIAAAHDALWRAWPRVADWIARNRIALQAHARLSAHAQRWQEARRPDDLLLTQGLPLAEARALEEADFVQLSDSERALIKSSVARGRRLQRLRTATLSVIVALSLAAGASGLYAWRARHEAERHRASAESLITFMLGDLTTNLRPLGKLDILDKISEEVLTHLDQTTDNDNDRTAQLQRIDAWSQIGAIETERGDIQKSLAAYDKANHALTHLAQRYPRDTAVLSRWGNVQFGLGNLLIQQNEFASTADHFQKYLDISLELIDIAPKDSGWWLEVSYAYNNIGTLEDLRGRTDKASSAFEKSIEWKRRVLSAQPDNIAVKSDLADTLSWLATEFERRGDLRAAERHYLEAQQIAEQTLKTAPDNAGYQYRDALAYMRVGDIQASLGNLSAAEKQYSAAQKLLNVITETEPSNLQWKVNALYTQLQLCKLAIGTSLSPRSELASTVAHVTNELSQLASQHAPKAAWSRLAAEGQEILGQVYALEGQTHESIEQFRKSVITLNALLQKAPTDNRTRHALAHALASYGFELSQNGKDIDAANIWQQIIDLVGAGDTHDPRALMPLALALKATGQRNDADRVLSQLSAMEYTDPYLTFISSHPSLPE